MTATFLPPMMHVRLLGSICVVHADGRTISIPSPSQRRLLAVLALGSTRSRRAEYLVELLGVSDGALRTTISRLRARIGEQSLTTDAIGYRLGIEVDIDIFERLLDQRLSASDGLAQIEQALGLWRGDAIDEFSTEPWAIGDACRLEELRATATEERAGLLIGLRRFGEAIAALELHTARFPLRDRPRELLMRALALDGRQTEALRSYQNYRSFLAAEFGTEPSLEIRELEDRIATGCPANPGLVDR